MKGGKRKGEDPKRLTDRARMGLYTVGPGDEKANELESV